MTPLPDHLLESFAAEAVREGLADALFSVVDTPIGRLVIVQGGHGIVRIGFEAGEGDALLAGVAGVLGPRVLRSERELGAARDAVSAYLEGDDEELDLPVDLALVRSPFRRTVLEHLRRVPRGTTVSYGALALAAGNPKAARAVGSACATNPIPLLVPCHRVLPGTGRVGNYGLGGPAVKTRLLQMEGALDQPPLTGPRTDSL